MPSLTERPDRRGQNRHPLSRSRRVCAAALVALLVSAAACSSDKDGGSVSRDAEIPFIEVDPDSTSPTDRAIEEAQATLRDDPTDPNAQLDLAQAFLQKGRETADPTLYTSAEILLEKVAVNAPDDPRVLNAKGSLALTRHLFTDALALGDQSLEVAPGNETAYGVRVDALNELGRYDEAVEATQEMVDVRPSLASLSRVSYARELQGDLDGAIEAMGQALTAAAGSGGENVAFVQVLLGDLLLTRGDMAAAETQYDEAEETFPGLPAARAAQARLLVAQERYAEAAQLLGELVEERPLIEYAVAQGDALTAAGRGDEAEDAYALVDGIAQLLEAAGVQVDVDLALFDAQQNPGEEAVAQARRGLDQRSSIIGHDALAWSLFTAGQVPEAVQEIEAALVTGSRDPRIRYHAAEIAAADGDETAAMEHLQVVLDTNPRFSAAHVTDVAELATRLGLVMPPVPTA